jgi:hypothetical protein
MSFLRSRDDTQPWKGAYYPYDLIKEACIAIGVIALLAVLLTILFSSPNEKPSTVAQWSRQLPVNFVATAAKELNGTSDTAEYGPPYNHNSKGVHAAFLYPQKWFGVSHPINTANDFVLDPLKSVQDVEPGKTEVDKPSLESALAQYEAAPEQTQKAWGEAYAKPLAEHETALEEHKTPTNAVSVDPKTNAVTVQAAGAGPVSTMMSGLLNYAQSGGLDGALLTSHRFFLIDYTKPLLFMADGGLLAERAEHEHLLGEQWGMMNETGSYPGQAWLWLYALWYQVEPFKESANADILVMLMMSVLSLAFICIPLIPGIRDIPRRIPLYRLIWREHYRSLDAAPPTAS